MINYEPQSQLKIFEFENPFDTHLDIENRWVKLSNILPWDDLVSIYTKSLSSVSGRMSIDCRVAVGALIIKHKMKLSDREVIETIKENIYIQYFLGFKKFTIEPVFHPTVFVDLRKRVGVEKFDKMTLEIIELSEKRGSEKQKSGKKKMNEPDCNKSQPSNKNEKENTNITNDHDKQAGIEAAQVLLPQNKGKLKIDATVADQMIVYPTDHGLLNRAREESERLIDIIYKKSTLGKKPRTYRRVARKEFLFISKKKRKTKNQIRKAIGKQLRYLKRNIKILHKLLNLLEGSPFPLNKSCQKIFWVIQMIYDQQNEMYREKKHSVQDRIVNIYQPYVRPIPRGKEKVKVEFGAKLGVSEVDGFARLNHLSWDAYNESTDLKQQVEDYFNFHGFYPEVLLGDKIYLNRENRNWLKERHIRISGKPFGRPPENESYYQKNKLKKENRERNHIEGKFGQGKNAYGLKQIRARRMDTSESWIANIFFVMNLVKLEKIMMVIMLIAWLFFDLYLLLLSKSKVITRYIRSVAKFKAEKITEKIMSLQKIQHGLISN